MLTQAELEKQTQAPTLVAIALGFISATTVVILLRMYTRLFMLRMAGPDDWSILVAMAFAVVVSVGTCFEAKYGMGRHAQFVEPEDTALQLRWLYVSILHYNMGMNIVKLSFLFQFRRIFESSTVQKICLWSMIYVGLWAGVQITLLGISCLPIEYIVPSTAGWCLDTLPVWYFSSAMSLATDILIFSIPLPSVVRLKLPLKQKIMVILIFCLGFFVCIISVYRMCTLRGAVESQDPPWDNVGAAIWSVIELNCAIICASLPTLRPLVAKVVPGMSSNHSGRATYERYGSKYATSSASRARSRPTFLESKQSPKSISTEELALSDMSPGSQGPSPRVYVVAGRQEPAYTAQDSSRHILVTTETMVRKH